MTDAPYDFAPAAWPTGEGGAPNPFLDVVADLVDNGEKDAAVSFVAPMGDKTKKGKWANLEKVRRQLRDAGTAKGVTVRTRFAEDTPTKGSATVTFRRTAKVQRKAKTPTPAA